MPDQPTTNILSVIRADDQQHARPEIDHAARPAYQESVQSPLWMLTTEPLLNHFVIDLQELRDELWQHPHVQRELHFSRDGLAAVRTAFATMIRHGEQHLHQLAQLLCASFLGAFQIESVVFGEVDATGERFTLTQSIDAADLYSTTDIDLGTRQLTKLQFFDGQGWSKASLVANIVEYQPTEPNAHAIYRMHTRIKAEEEIWNKVVDEIFDLDRLVAKDKELRHLSRYVKDVFGIKIVVGEEADAYRVHDALLSLAWPDPMLTALHVQPSASTTHLTVVEVKNYLADGQQKRSGWGALKLVARWADKTFEIQIQPLRNFLHERERLTSESHVSFKAQRDQIRQRVAEQVPLFGFYQALLRWLFLLPAAPPPVYQGVTVVLDD